MDVEPDVFSYTVRIHPTAMADEYFFVRDRALGIIGFEMISRLLKYKSPVTVEVTEELKPGRFLESPKDHPFRVFSVDSELTFTVCIRPPLTPKVHQWTILQGPPTVSDITELLKRYLNFKKGHIIRWVKQLLSAKV